MDEGKILKIDTVSDTYNPSTIYQSLSTIYHPLNSHPGRLICRLSNFSGVNCNDQLFVGGNHKYIGFG